MRKLKKRAAAWVMSLAMLLSLVPLAFAADYADMPGEGDWAREAVQAAVDNGLLNGSGGMLRPGDNISRAELAKIVAKAFGAEEEGDISAFSDVSAQTWYYGWVAKANQMGIMKGSNGMMRPNSPITRQEAFAVLARALKLADGTAEDLAAFSDGGDVAGWFVGPVSAMVKGGYVAGGGKLNPTGNMSRTEFAQVLHNIFAVYITQAGTYTEVGERSVMISAPDVTLKGCAVKGDLVIADGVGDGDVTLDNVTVEGRLVVRGGGVNSIHIINGSKIASDVVVTKVNGNVRVFADVTSSISMITVEDGRDDVVIEGTVGIVTVASSETPVIVRNAAVSGVAVTAPGASVTLEDSRVNTVAVSAADALVELAGKTTVAAVQVAADAQGTTVNAGADTKIETIKADTDVTMNGDGRVEKTEGEGKVSDVQGEEIKPAPVIPDVSSKPDKPSEPTPPAPHTHVWATEWSKGEGTHWHACAVSGCTAVADLEQHRYSVDDETKNLVCSTCGAIGPKEDYDHEHIFDENHYEWNADLPYAATEHIKRCAVDGCTYGVIVPHTMGAPVNGRVSCTKCGYETDAGCANGHNVPTWKMDGITHIGNCSVCGEKLQEYHIWGIEAVDGKVTCTAPGCGATQNVSGTPHVHNYGPWWRIPNSIRHERYCGENDCNYDGAYHQTGSCVDDGNGVCKDCGSSMNPETCEHNWLEIMNSSTATCTEAGIKEEHCTKCGTERTVDDPAKGHAWGEATLNADDGKYYHTCSSCHTTEETGAPEGSGG